MVPPTVLRPVKLAVEKGIFASMAIVSQIGSCVEIGSTNGVVCSTRDGCLRPIFRNGI